MTTETIEPGAPRTWQDTPDPTHRFTAEQMGLLRQQSCAGRFRWLARLSRWGPQVWCQHDSPFGHPGPAVVEMLPSAGPSLAASAVGVAVNYSQRPSDGMRCGEEPEGQKFLKTLDVRIAAGYVERTWVDRHGVVGIIALWREEVHEDLRRLEARDALAAAQLCLGFTADLRFSRGPWQLPVFRVVGGRAFSVDFTALTHALGSRIVRRLAPDEEPAEGEIVPSDAHPLPPSGLPPEENIADIINQVPSVSTADLVPGSITTPTIAAKAATNQTKTVNTGSTSKTPGSTSDISGRTATQTITDAGSLVFVDFQGSAMLSNTDLSATQIAEVIYNLTRGDNTVLVTGAIRMTLPAGTTGGSPMVVHFSENGVSGSQTYKLRWNVTGSVNNNVGATLSGGDTLTIVEFKR